MLRELLSGFDLRDYNPSVRRFFLYAILFFSGMALFSLLYNLYLLRLSYQEDFIGRMAGLFPLASGLAALPTGVLDLGYSRADVTCPAGKAICPELTAPQRPIAMILADAEDPETDIGQALQTGIAAHEAAGADVLPGVKVSDYSAFELR